MIKSELKLLEINLKDLAEALHLSRPTLNQYIRLFESGKRIPNATYQAILSRLFKQTCLSRESFLKELAYCQLVLKTGLPETCFELPNEETFLATALIRDIKMGIQSQSVDPMSCQLIRLFLTHPPSETLVQGLQHYYRLQAGLGNVESLTDEDKCFISQFHSLVKGSETQALTLDEASYQSFLNELPKQR